MNRACGETQGMDCGDSLLAEGRSLGKRDSRWDARLRTKARLLWYHQKEVGSFEVVSFALASLAIVRHCRSHAPFCRGTCGEIVVSLSPLLQQYAM
eukprot:4285343-Pleurochrysis_carterae.AAC.2